MYGIIIRHNLGTEFFVCIFIWIGMVEFTLINKILIIDDGLIFCNAMKCYLSQKDYDVKI